MDHVHYLSVYLFDLLTGGIDGHTEESGAVLFYVNPFPVGVALEPSREAKVESQEEIKVCFSVIAADQLVSLVMEFVVEVVALLDYRSNLVLGYGDYDLLFFHGSQRVVELRL